MVIVAGDIHLNPNYDRLGDTNGFQNRPGKHGYMSLIHEIGHALGLKHPHDSTPVLPTEVDNTTTTVMSYDFKGNSSGTPMGYDLLALHTIYGVRSKWTGNDLYYFTRGADQYTLDGSTLYLNTPNLTKQTIWDNGGINTLDFSTVPFNNGGYRVDLNGLGWISLNSAYIAGTEPYLNYGTILAEGMSVGDFINSTSNDTIYANGSANNFKGYSPSIASGQDTIYNASGADTLDLSGYNTANVSQMQSGNDLVISLGSNGSVTLKDYYLGNMPTILLSGAIPSLSISDASVTEGNSGTVNASFALNLSAPASSVVTVNFATSDGTATVGNNDYIATSGTVTFQPGETQKSVIVIVNGDTIHEANETFAVNLSLTPSNSNGATIADGQAEGMIVNDDAIPNVPPQAAISANPTTGTAPLVVNFSGAASSDSDGTIVSYSWNFGDGSIANGVDSSHTYLASGNYIATLTVMDDDGASASAQQAINVASSLTVHVGDLEASGASAPRGRWDAAVRITVHNGNEEPVVNATVTGNWSGGASGSASCITDNAGNCTVAQNNLKSSVTSATFTVSDVTLGGASYLASANHDVDGDSNGTSIIASLPVANNAPTVSIASPSNGSSFAAAATINFSGSANDVEDGDISANLIWTSNIDGQIGTGASFSHVLGNGSHTISVSVIDSTGASGNATVNVVVGAPPPTQVVHVADLDVSTALGKGRKWDVSVTVTVHNSDHSTVANATVSGIFAGSISGSDSCTTDGSGRCTISRAGLVSNDDATFSVTSISAIASSYAASGNHDPEGDSNGTTIVVIHP